MTMGYTRMLPSVHVLGSTIVRCKKDVSSTQRRFSIGRKARVDCQKVGRSRPRCSARPENEQPDRIAAAQEAVTSALVSNQKWKEDKGICVVLKKRKPKGNNNNNNNK